MEQDNQDKQQGKKDKIVKELIEAGADISGNVGGAAVGFLFAGPPGAVLGGIAGPLFTRGIKKIGFEIQKRFLGPREEQRVGATLAYAITAIKQKQEEGFNIRDDDFFEEINSRSQADEILEGILIAAQRDHEEAKLKYYGHLLASIAFTPTIDRGKANFLIRVIQRLSYQQLCIIAFLYHYSEGKEGSNRSFWLDWSYSFYWYNELQHYNDMLPLIKELDALQLLSSSGGVNTFNTIALSIASEELFELANLKEIDRQDILLIEKKFDCISEIIRKKDAEKRQSVG
jgi:hypothetical protein